MKQVTIDNVRERIARIEECASRMPGGLRLSMNTEFELACLRQLLASLQVKPELWEIDNPGEGTYFVRDAPHSQDWRKDMIVQRWFAEPPVPLEGVEDDVRNVITLLENNEWADHCTKTKLGQRLETEITRLYNWRSAPVVPDSNPSLNAMMRALDAFYADDEVPERGMLAAFKILLADVRNQPAQVVVIPTIWKHYGGGKVAHLYEQAMDAAGVQWRSVDDEPQTTSDNTAQQFEALATSAGKVKS